MLREVFEAEPTSIVTCDSNLALLRISETQQQMRNRTIARFRGTDYRRAAGGRNIQIYRVKRGRRQVVAAKQQLVKPDVNHLIRR